MRRWKCCVCTSIFAIAVLYCEILADYMTLMKCDWPPPPPSSTEKEPESSSPPLRALILADTHLLGPLRGHWLDKLYREWHMHRSFQAAITLFQPDIVFVLGDLFDEGEFINHDVFQEHILRFQRLFRTPPHMPIISAVGNHDVGFHYKMHPYFTERFEKEFKNTGVQLYTYKRVHFVFLNSMAMENDGCYFCETALSELKMTASKLNCLKSPNTCNDKILQQQHGAYSRPILMQHFPTYRATDKSCRDYDAPKIEKFRENWEVLSKQSTDLLGKLLQPRLAFAGHIHHFCENINRLGIEEYTVASFNWRNKVNPSFLLTSLTATEHAISKCDMLQQDHVYLVYMVSALICALMLLSSILPKLKLKVV